MASATEWYWLSPAEKAAKIEKRVERFWRKVEEVGLTESLLKNPPLWLTPHAEPFPYSTHSYRDPESEMLLKFMQYDFHGKALKESAARLSKLRPRPQTASVTPPRPSRPPSILPRVRVTLSLVRLSLMFLKRIALTSARPIQLN
jgi:hypothetical protein